MNRPLFVEASKYDVVSLLLEWEWLVPKEDTPLFITAFGDWVFGKPDGSLWVLSVLEGSYECVACDAAEYNSLNKSEEWLNKIFIAEWFSIALGNGLSPTENECIGWKVHPAIGGKFEPENQQVFSMLVYQSIMGQLHRQLQQRAPTPQKVEQKPWFKFW